MLIAVVFLVVATGIALVRFRSGPLYPPFNDINSDVFVYQLVGNSWTQGLMPYRDVYDVKGPVLFLLFGFFAAVRPWSMAPPLVFLALLALISLGLAYAIARLHLQRRSLAALAAGLSCTLIYLSVADVPTSFTCEELAIPGVLLLLWLVARWLSERDTVADAWWVLDGAIFGVLLWTKYQVIAPWVAVFVALLVVIVVRRLRLPNPRRVILLHLAGAAGATAVILPAYLPVLPDLLRAYFLAKPGSLDLALELPSELAFVGETFQQNTGAALVLVGVLVALGIRAVHGDRRDGLTLAIAYCLSCWAAVALVRHPNNLFLPLTFCALAVPQLLAASLSRGRAVAGAGGVVLTALAAAACVAPLHQGVTSYGLLREPKPLSCYRLPSLERSTSDANVSRAFARAAGDRPILSVGTLFAARSSYISELPMTQTFQFVHESWSKNAGADGVQARYLQERTFAYAWIHISGVDRFGDLEAQIAAATYTDGPSQPEQAAALVRNYVPVLSCNNEILLRAR